MRFLPLLLTLFLTACGGGGKDARTGDHGTNEHESSKNYFKVSKRLTIQVAYEPAAEPYAGSVSPGNPFSVWQLTEENLFALYQGRADPPLISVPKTLDQFQVIPAQNKTSWKLEELYELAQEHRNGESSASHTYFWVVFLKGHYHDGKKLQTGTVGLAIGGTTVIAIFKDVVEGTGAGQSAPLMQELVPRYVEQSTVVHELGHALGLVDNGIPMHQPHKDADHGAHCNNPDCVMYWVNEGTGDLANFVRNMITSGGVVMYDQKCLDDARKF